MVRVDVRLLIGSIIYRKFKFQFDVLRKIEYGNNKCFKVLKINVCNIF